jgi:hypothetical protein
VIPAAKALPEQIITDDGVSIGLNKCVLTFKIEL